MSYGKVISGGKAMTKGLTKGINDKLEGFAKEQDRRKTLATAVRGAFDKRNLDNNQIQNVNGSKFQTPKVPKNV